MANIDIKFIAKKSGCSIATVSRVINHSKPVSENLQKKVIDTIRKYNYNPSVHARYLAGKKSRLLGFIMTNYINQYPMFYIMNFLTMHGAVCARPEQSLRSNSTMESKAPLCRMQRKNWKH